LHGKIRNEYKIVAENLERRDHLGEISVNQKNSAITTDINETGCKGMDRIQLA
jgi:hypothetical protein